MKTLTVQEFADAMGWSHDTVTRMVKAGEIKGSKKNPFAMTSPFLIPEAEVGRIRKLARHEQTERKTRSVA